MGATLRTGIIFTPAGSGFLDEHIRDGGWSIEGTVRQELGNMCCPFGGPYFEIGGSYMHNYGIDEFVSTSGTLIEIPLGLPPVNMPLQDFFFTRLNHLQRASLQLGLGAAWLSPPFLNPSYNDKVLLNVRGGVRFGHVHARYDQQPTPDLQTLIDAVPATSTFVLRDDVEQTDQFFGLYVAAGLEIASIPVPLFPGMGEFRLVTEVTYEHSWFDLGAYGESDSGLGTAAALVGVTVAW